MTWSCLDALEDSFVPYDTNARTIVIHDLADSQEFDEVVGSLIRQLSLDVESMGLISSTEFGVTFHSRWDVVIFWLNYPGRARSALAKATVH